MDAEVGLVDQLGDRDVSGDADQLIGPVPGELLLRDQEVDHLLDGALVATARSGSVAMLMKSVAVSARGQVSFMSLRTVSCKPAAQRGLDRRLIDLAIALRGVAVADLEQRTGGEDRDVERAAGDELAVIEVAGVATRRDAADAACLCRRRDADAAVERAQAE